MAKRDVYHDIVRRVLEADGWTITDDPLTLKFGSQSVYVDLGAEEAPLAAQKASRRIAVEVKSFLAPSAITEMERALGQYGFYRFLLTRQYPDKLLYLAVPENAYISLFDTADGRDLIASLSVRLLVFDSQSERIVRWIE